MDGLSIFGFRTCADNYTVKNNLEVNVANKLFFTSMKSSFEGTCISTVGYKLSRTNKKNRKNTSCLTLSKMKIADVENDSDSILQPKFGLAIAGAIKLNTVKKLVSTTSFMLKKSTNQRHSKI